MFIDFWKRSANDCTSSVLTFFRNLGCSLSSTAALEGLRLVIFFSTPATVTLSLEMELCGLGHRSSTVVLSSLVNTEA